MRVLSKGSVLPFVHESVGWDESINFKDFDIIFVNLRSLEESAENYDHPYNESDESPNIFDSSEVTTFIKTGGFMVVYLPDSLTVSMGNTTTKPKENNTATIASRGRSAGQKDKEVDPYDEYELLNWLPFSIKINTEESGKSVTVLKEEWEWYFGNRFVWDKIISHSTRNSSYKSETIAENSYSESIATKVTHRYGSSDGYAAFIPPDESLTYSDFVKDTLQYVFGMGTNIEGHAPPPWLSKYSLPNEGNIEDTIQEKKKEIKELEEELESLTKFKKLLYETHTNLEEVTRDALRKLGFTVDDEVPGKRDGILHTWDTQFVLEITGTTGGIKKSKARQLDDWVENVIAENPGDDISGLLIVNPEMERPPEERDVSLEPNVEAYLKRRGDYKVLTTIDLYHLVKSHLKDGVDRDDIEEIFYQEDTLLSPEEYKS
ncbi:hypothetical protein [Halalkalicoccus sp. NIPERK01]|uniref:hypothetical protein n=1 Tax=Halalkalicoccus sp. NIPERK01 TaxID=3053469 RepID=UPI00256F08B3|nr:hypothetical protein [Halalkalicoccus sp. NIPERK01]MDL5360390.1 hypothetical protein [Halalkalicoccus sp. NIPERK01]